MHVMLIKNSLSHAKPGFITEGKPVLILKLGGTIKYRSLEPNYIA